MAQDSIMAHLLGQHLINSSVPLNIYHESAPGKYYFLKDVVRAMNKIRGMTMQTIVKTLSCAQITNVMIDHLEELGHLVDDKMVDSIVNLASMMDKAPVPTKNRMVV